MYSLSVPSLEERVLDALPQAWGKGVLRNLFFPSISREAMDDKTYQGFEQLISSRQWVRQHFDFMKKTDVSAMLPNIKCPPLVLHFSGDLAVPIRLGRALVDISGFSFFFYEIFGVVTNLSGGWIR